MVEEKSNEAGWVIDCIGTVMDVTNRISGKRTGDTVGGKYPSLKRSSPLCGVFRPVNRTTSTDLSSIVTNSKRDLISWHMVRLVDGIYHLQIFQSGSGEE